MAVTIRDFLALPIMQDFKVVAGAKGLDRAVTATEILDFELIQEGEEYRERGFTGNSLVLSSLLFAKDKPEMILQSVKKLISQNVQALAYKPVFFKELPEEALAYADDRNFPILEFGHDEFFEDIIFSIKDLVEKDDVILHTEPLLSQMLTRDFTAEEALDACEKLNHTFRPVLAAVCIKAEGMTAEAAAGLIRRGRPDRKLRSKTFVGKYEDCIFAVLSQDEVNPDRFQAQLTDVLIAYGLMGKKITVGISEEGSTSRRLDKMVREAYWTEKVAEIEKKDVKRYRDLGIYKLIISNLHNGTMEEYMESYLAPLFEEEEKDGELLHTAAAYILAKGDTIKTAEQLYCHKNTIRYRIGKLQEKLDPDSNEKEFYQNLAAAVKIYLLLHNDKEEKQ